METIGTPLHALAAFAAGLRFEDLPAEVTARATEVLRDTVGVIVGGMAEPEVRALADHAAARAAGKATLLGHGGRCDPAWAVLVHGTAGTSLELDEGHAFARGHAAIHAVPTALALAEARGASGRELIADLVAGYEVAARAGVATRLRPEVHPFGTWGVLGAAAIGARVHGLDAAGVAGTLELAASYAIAPSFGSALQGATVRNTYAGAVNRLGLLAAELYPLGFRGEKGGLEVAFGRILGERFDPDALADGLGTRFELMRGYFKPYSSCRYTHGAVEAALALRADLDAPLERVERVTVETYDVAATLRETRPATPLAGRFSLPHVVAACLVLGHAGPAAFSREALEHPGIRALASRVMVAEDPAFTALTPAQRPSRLTLELQGGRRLRREVYGSRGDPDQPLTPAELEAKFLDLVAPRYGAEEAELLWRRLGELASLPDVTRFADQAFRPPPEVPMG